MKALFSFRRFSTLIMAAFIFLSVQNSHTPENVDAPPSSQKIAVIMYHGFCNNDSDSTYVLKISDFEKDIRFLCENGYEFIFASEYFDLCTGNKEADKKTIMITFDDGCWNNYTLAFDILKKYKAKAVISPIMYYCEADSKNPSRNQAYSSLNFSEIKEMYDSELVEFQNHSYNMHSVTGLRKGSAIAKGESKEEYRKIFYRDTLRSHNLLYDITKKSPIVYAYPFGNICKQSKSILLCMGYKLAFGCEEGFNYPQKFKNELIILKRFNRTPQKSVEQLLSEY